MDIVFVYVTVFMILRQCFFFAFFMPSNVVNMGQIKKLCNITIKDSLRLKKFDVQY